MLDIFQKVNKQKNKIINQKQQKLVHFLENKIKIFHKTVKNSLKIFQHQDSIILQNSIVHVYNVDIINE